MSPAEEPRPEESRGSALRGNVLGRAISRPRPSPGRLQIRAGAKRSAGRQGAARTWASAFWRNNDNKSLHPPPSRLTKQKAPEREPPPPHRALVTVTKESSGGTSGDLGTEELHWL